ncbi:MAG TPA: enoyl-CoA hydratase-related protein, partial [Candidatus Angelobacter sp.]|nr:enoyl-CoA hydratase-related protein [Candidatus Angelobacter sp.]
PGMIGAQRNFHEAILRRREGHVSRNSAEPEYIRPLRRVLSCARPAFRRIISPRPKISEVSMAIRLSVDAKMMPNTQKSSSSYKFIQFEISGFVARLTLDHPPHNVLTVPMMKEMAEAIEGLNGLGDVKAILLQSSQPAFSAGISLEDSRPDRVFQTLDAFTRVFQAMIDISKPVIVVVNGPAIGAGSELVGFADVVIATPKAKFAQPEVKLGVFPPFAAVMLPQLIGPKKTYELILTGEALSAEEALRFGFVNKVVPEAELTQQVEALLARISEFSGPVLEVIKRVIGGGMGLPLKEAMKKSHDLYLNELMNLEDVQEGLRAVIEKRKPVWKNK